MGPEDTRSRFAALASPGSTTMELDEAAWLVAAAYSSTAELGTMQRHLDRLADRVRERVPGGGSDHDRLGALIEILAHEAGFQGNADDYYDPRNSFLDEVLARRVGIPITLSVLYMEVARRAHLPLVGIGFPGHFLVRYPGPEAPVILDPFSRGSVVSEAALLERLSRVPTGRPGSPERAAAQRLLATLLAGCDVRAIVARMLANLKAIFLERRDYASALLAVDRLLMLAPDEPQELRMRAALHHRLEAHRAALADYRRYLTLVPDTEDASEIRGIIATLARQVDHLN
jgi:regulator of sirC expression with transglutaminase-like and TPR domain